MSPTTPPWHEVRQSSLHGHGVFARRFIPKGTYILEYEGLHITPAAADAQEATDPNDPYHTFFFALSNGMIIDGGQGGNDSRFINHSCEPNCEGHENAEGTAVYIVALRDIQPNEELLYDYALTIDDKITQTLRQQYACLCQSPSCRGTMLDVPKKTKNQKQKAKLKKQIKKAVRKELQHHLEELRIELRDELLAELRAALKKP